MLRGAAWDIWTYGEYRVVRCTWCGGRRTMEATDANLFVQAGWAEEHEKICPAGARR